MKGQQTAAPLARAPLRAGVARDKAGLGEPGMAATASGW